MVAEITVVEAISECSSLLTPPSSLMITPAAPQPHFRLKVLDPPEPSWTLKHRNPNIK
jgi:hypothetical protein